MCGSPHAAGSVVSTLEVAFCAADGSALQPAASGAVTEVVSEWGGSLLDPTLQLPAPPPSPAPYKQAPKASAPALTPLLYAAE